MTNPAPTNCFDSCIVPYTYHPCTSLKQMSTTKPCDGVCAANATTAGLGHIVPGLARFLPVLLQRRALGRFVGW